MAEIDHYFKLLLKDKERFADFCNVVVFQGMKILTPQNLEYVPTETGIVILDSQGVKRAVQRRRDVLMKANFSLASTKTPQTDLFFMLTAAEEQEQVHYAMPVRAFLYDALDYAEQIASVSHEHESEGESLKGAEFLSGFGKRDRIIPIISFVVYLGRNIWDGPTTLYDMMGIKGEELAINQIKKVLPNYHINLVTPQNMECLDQFQTSLQYIFGMLKYNGEKRKLYEYTKENQKAIKGMDSDSMMAALAFLGEQKRLMKILAQEDAEKEEWNMCQAIDDLIADGKEEGQYTKLITQVMKKAEKGQLIQQISEDLMEPFDVIEKIFITIKNRPGAGVEEIYNLVR